jgi:P27 family predicted phage terminase small subunit
VVARKASIPKAIRVAKGSKHAKYDNTDEDVPDTIAVSASEMEMPEDFHNNDYEVEAWNELVKSLGDRKILSPAFREMMILYCRSKAQYEEVSALIKEEGMTTTNSVGKTVINPLMALQRTLVQELRNFGKEFGLTPYANACIRIPIENKADDSPKKRFFANAG